MSGSVSVPSWSAVPARSMSFPWIAAADGTPILVLGAADDAFFPPWMVEETALLYRVAAEIVPRMAHAIMLDARWREPAGRLLAWLGRLGAH